MIDTGPAVEIPTEVLSNPALLFLYYRVEQALGIKPASEALIKLNDHLEKCCGASFIDNPAAYEYLLSSQEQIFEISRFLTINETYFFREGAHFGILAQLLPQLAKLKRPVHICSAATSIGCEAYSIAMLLDYHARNGLDFGYAIDAFDISAEVIETAKNARYTPNTLRIDGSGWKYILDSYLVPDGGEYVVAENIRNKVCFFTRNIMHGFDRQYDIIFFRNALIYFSSRNRIVVMNEIAESLFDGGLLFPGMSEVSSVQHPLLTSRFLSDNFYFQKANGDKADNLPPLFPITKNECAAPRSKPARPKHAELPVASGDIAAILEKEEGQLNAKNVLDALAGGIDGAEEGFRPPAPAGSLSGGEVAAAAVYFLGIQDFYSADRVLSYLEKHNTGAPSRFLRGEYYFLQGRTGDAERCFREAAAKDRMFWPAFYRIATLAAEGDRTRYVYNIRKAVKSIELSQGAVPDAARRYEYFLGGFSPDYFRRILEKKLE